MSPFLAEPLESRRLLSVTAQLRPGSLDPTFADQGTLWPGIAASARSLAAQQDGKILDFGFGNTGLLVTRYESNGTIDASFGQGSNSVIPFAPDPSALFGAEALAVLVQSDDRIMEVGWDGGSHLLIGRLLANGAPDATFGSGGVVSTDATNFEPEDAQLESDGTLIILGRQIIASGYELEARRYNQDGTPDASFGQQGTVILDPKSLASVHLRVGLNDAVAVEPDGQTVISACTSAGELLLRLNPDGSLDKTFGRNGIVRTELSLSYPGGVVVEQPNDDILVTSGARVERFEPDGKPDPRFGTGGMANLPSVGNSNYCAAGIAVVPDGRIAVGVVARRLFSFIEADVPNRIGLPVNYAERHVLGITWLTPHGSIDSKMKAWRNTTPLSQEFSVTSLSMVLQPGGKLLVEDHDVLARLLT